MYFNKIKYWWCCCSSQI